MSSEIAETLPKKSAIERDQTIYILQCNLEYLDIFGNCLKSYVSGMNVFCLGISNQEISAYLEDFEHGKEKRRKIREAVFEMGQAYAKARNEKIQEATKAK